ncbi:MAG TPA: class I SAM-dependent methyltransferase [Bryobacteraceae bacterium]
METSALLRNLAELAPGLHTAGTLSGRVLERIAEHAARRRILHSAETGCGASTLLLSHLSPDHTVFAFDGGSGSVTNVRRSPLLRREFVTFIDGPTQRTLPAHRFEAGLQFALLDGPHAYPFPDLEYYYLYPHLEPGALLVVDDIQICTVHHLYDFLAADAMFRRIEVAGSTAFFERTEAPLFDPLADGWQQQNYNRTPLWRYTWRDALRRAGIRRRVRAQHGAQVRILTPAAGAPVDAEGLVSGSATVPEGGYLWVLVRRSGIEGWWPQGGAPAAVEQGSWGVPVHYGEPRDAGFDFEIAAVIIGAATNEAWLDWAERARETGACPPVVLPPARFLWAQALRTVRKVQAG